MAVLTKVKRNLTILGVVPVPKQNLPQPLQEYQSIIDYVHVTFLMISLISYASGVVYFLLFEASTFVEYSQQAFFCAVSLLHVLSYLILIQNRSNLLTLFRDTEKIISKRKCSLE